MILSLSDLAKVVLKVMYGLMNMITKTKTKIALPKV